MKANVTCFAWSARSASRFGIDLKSSSRARRFAKKCASYRNNPPVSSARETQERALAGDVISTVALAGQTCREFAVSNKGVDMEIEFNDDQGNPTGHRLYLQLKSGTDVTHWLTRRVPVMLVTRDAAGEVRWIAATDRISLTKDERFDVMSVRRWRDRILNPGTTQ